MNDPQETFVKLMDFEPQITKFSFQPDLIFFYSWDIFFEG